MPELTADATPEPTPRPAPPRGAWIRLFAVRGIGIFVDPLLVLLLLGLAVFGEDAAGTVSRFTFVGILLGSVLLHELGHAWVAMRRGLRVSGVYLHLLPFAYVERGDARDELAVALAGPAVSLLVTALLWVPLGAGGGLPPLDLAAWFEDPVALALGVNALMGVVNLVPALPLDGGRALRAALTLSRPARAARRTASLVGAGVGVTVVGLALVGLGSPARYYVAGLGAYLCLVAWREARHQP